MSSVVELLLSLGNPDNVVQRNAEAVIYNARDENLGAFLSELVRIVRDEKINEIARQQALILLKNTVAFNARDEQNKKLLESRWNSIDLDTRANVRKEILNTLGSPTRGVRFIAALVVANLARLELPRQQWPELLNALFHASKAKGHMEAAITTLGYICEESNSCSALAEELQQHANRILDCVINGMRDTDEEVCYQSTNSLCNAITFIHGNMDVPAERDFIMQTICANCVNHEPRTIVKGLECLVRIAFEYYTVLSSYMPALFSLTVQSIQTENEDTALQGFQFWTTICEVELVLLEEHEGEDCQGYASKAAPQIVPVALQSLLKQEEGQSDDDWNVCAAGGICLRGFAQVLKNDILSYVMPFVTNNAKDSNWKNCDAALTAFGGILDGPDTAAVGQSITGAMPLLLQYTASDQHPMVRESAVWVLSRIANFHAPVILQEYLDQVVRLSAGLIGDIPSIGNKACSILHNLCIELEGDTTTPATNAMSAYFEPLVTTLLQCMDRPNAHESNLRGAAQETLNSLLSCAAEDIFTKVNALIPEFVARIEKTTASITPDIPTSTLQELQLTQGLFCGSLQHVCHKLGKRLTKESVALMMRACQRALVPVGETVSEEAVLLVGALAAAIGTNFQNYLPDVAPAILSSLRNCKEPSLCTIAVGTVGDIVAALGTRTPESFCDEFIGALLANVRSDDLPQSTRPPILSCFGDIALHTEGIFEKYLPVVMNVLDSAASAVDTIDPENDEMLEFGEDLRESICEAFTGIIQGMKGKISVLTPYVPKFLQFIMSSGMAKQVSDPVLSHCVSVLGDLLNVFGSQTNRQHCPSELVNFVRNKQVQEMVERAMKSNNEETRDAAQWTRKEASSYL